ncbi:MAG: hypothetical protein JXB85_01680 [Anaerolineales bacterium]|nr:hypothetical protein [Anaerolineales bacterium]
MAAPILRRLWSLFGWTRHSSVLLGGFFLVVFLIIYVWWPLAEELLAYIDWSGPWWLYFDWLLVGLFLFMTLTIMSRADLKTDLLIVFVGTVGGLVIESWGTQTNLWFYYTAERPPLWIIPAWPIASLSIDRLTRLLGFAIRKMRSCLQGARPPEELPPSSFFVILYWLIFAAFFALMLSFVAPTFNKSYTILATLLVALLILTPTDHRLAVLTFVAGAGLGYYLELWGTTRQCWTYYTYQTPPLFAVLAHGMAAVAFWRAGLMVQLVWGKLTGRENRQIWQSTDSSD